MSILESIVPPLDLCKMIPAGEFEDSVLMWRERIGNISRDERVKIREPEDISYKVESATVNYFPAPTLEEILIELSELGAVFCKCWIRIGIESYEYPINSKEALLLWFEVKGINLE